MIHHIVIVFGLIWILDWFRYRHPIVYFISLIYLYQVHERYYLRLRKKTQYEERKQANQRRPLADSETVRWLNDAVEKVWPICMEQIASQKILLPLVPWFLDKYKPWTAKKAEVQELYLGRNPPMITEMRVVRQSSDDDHLVLELGINFLTAEDMSALIAVKLRRRLGFGMWTKLHMTGMHVEGKIVVGLKFIRQYPYLGRLRLCFAEPPYFQMTVKPIFNHGIDVTEFPGIAGWMDKLLGIVFEQTLVEPNMLVVDVEKFASATTDNWFSVDEKDPVAYVKVEIVEGADMKPSDPNGLADPYVKGQLGPYRFRTKTQKKTLSPKWIEEFRIPICTWESPNVLTLEVCDKDHFRDDTLGNCSVNITDYRSMQRHDMWLPLQNIKMGRLHLAVTVLDAYRKGGSDQYFVETSNTAASTDSTTTVTGQTLSDPTIFSVKVEKMVDKYEPIKIEGRQQTGIWVHHPGSDVPQIWEPRKRKNRLADIKIHRVENTSTNTSAETGWNQKSGNSSNENEEISNSKSLLTVRRGLRKLSLAFNKIHSRKDSRIISPSPSPTPRPNIRAVNERTTKLKVIVDDEMCEAIGGFDTSKPCSSSPEMKMIGSTDTAIMKEVASDVLDSNTVKELKADKKCSSPQPMNVKNYEGVKGFKADDEFLSPWKIGSTVKDFKAEEEFSSPRGSVIGSPGKTNVNGMTEVNGNRDTDKPLDCEAAEGFKSEKECLSPGRNGGVSSSKGKLKAIKAKGMIKNVLSRKWSKKRNNDSGSAAVLDSP
ncbi:hypothetical protein MKW92_012964 [Papaver armeniacum]|nr:hypothetical protein MKW92_012964 [Papaver armeniacum]